MVGVFKDMVVDQYKRDLSRLAAILEKATRVKFLHVPELKYAGYEAFLECSRNLVALKDSIQSNVRPQHEREAEAVGYASLMSLESSFDFDFSANTFVINNATNGDVRQTDASEIAYMLVMALQHQQNGAGEMLMYDFHLNPMAEGLAMDIAISGQRLYLTQLALEKMDEDNPSKYINHDSELKRVRRSISPTLGERVKFIRRVKGINAKADSVFEDRFGSQPTEGQPAVKVGYRHVLAGDINYEAVVEQLKVFSGLHGLAIMPDEVRGFFDDLRRSRLINRIGHQYCRDLLARGITHKEIMTELPGTLGHVGTHFYRGD